LWKRKTVSGIFMGSAEKKGVGEKYIYGRGKSLLPGQSIFPIYVN
jgi:hypothetical protein